MFEPTFFIVGALAILCVHPSSALNPKQANSVCALLPDGETIANPIDCTQYYSCSKGKAILNSCLGSNLFSKEDQTCVQPNQSSCGSEQVDPCAYMSDGYYVSVENTCSDFYYCSGGVGTKSSCPNGLNFDQGHQSCVYASEFPCTETIPGDESINLCEVIRSDIYFGVSTSCKKWQKCQLNGPSKIGECAAPWVFNVDTQSCSYQENASCRQLQGNPGTGGSSLEGTPCDTNDEVQADTTCAGYYVCTNGKYAFGKCINGQYFNPKTNKCVARLDAINDCDRCEGTKLQFVNLYQDDCKGYGYCRNGKMQSTGVCASGYFSELSGSCDQSGDNPEYPVCYVSEDSEPSTPEPTTKSTTKPDPTPKTDASSTSTPADVSTTTDKTLKTTKSKKSTTEASTTNESSTKSSTSKEESTSSSTEASSSTTTEDEKKNSEEE